MVKVGVSVPARQAQDALRYFDYVETFDRPIEGQAYHSNCGETRLDGRFIYVVRHLDCLTDIAINSGMVVWENPNGWSFEQVSNALRGRLFILDVAHAYKVEVGRFDIRRWLSLKPIAAHLSNVKIINGTPWDHQLLSNGSIDINEVINAVVSSGVEYITLEIFFTDAQPHQYSPIEIYQDALRFSSLLPALKGEAL